MAFTVRDYQDLVHLLGQHPEWQAELRRLLLADDFLALPDIVRDLAEAQRQSEARLTRVEESLAALAEAQQRTEARLEQSEIRLTRVEESLEQLSTEVRALTGEMQRWADWQRGEAGRQEGERYEQRIVRRAAVLFNGGQGGSPTESSVYQRLLGIVRRLPDLAGLAEERDPMLADLIWWKNGDVAIVEVSRLVNSQDVVRAARRAETLRRVDVQAIGMVIGGEWSDEEARRQAEAEAVEWRVGSDLSDGYLAFCHRPA